MKQPNYTDYAFCYDEFELAGYSETDELNNFLDDLFQLNSVSTILDFACGTGGQAIGLAKRDYVVTAVDLNQAMLDKAKAKLLLESQKHLEIHFALGDMRTTKLGFFDAVISIFNAIGHLTPEDCSKFFENSYSQLSKGGLFIIDIFNLSAMTNNAFSEYEHLEREIEVEGQHIHHVRNCKLDKQNAQISIASRTYAQDGKSDPIIVEDSWTMQIYTSKQLKKMLNNAGFKEIHFFGRTGTDFDDKLSDTIMAVCQK